MKYRQLDYLFAFFLRTVRFFAEDLFMTRLDLQVAHFLRFIVASWLSYRIATTDLIFRCLILYIL